MRSNKEKGAQSAKREMSATLAACVIGALCAMVTVTATAEALNSAQVKRISVEQPMLESASELVGKLATKWERVLREGYGLSESGMQQFKSGYGGYPAAVLQQALEAKSFEAMNAILMDHNQTLVNGLADRIKNSEGTEDVDSHKIKASMRKALGDEGRDLVYIPITPCRTFDTRTAAYSGFGGQVTPGNPKQAFVFWAGAAPTDWTAGYGGIVANCPDTAQNGILLSNVAPYSTAVNISTVAPTADGWITAYRGDLADPSNTVVTNLVKAGTLQTALAIVTVCRGVSGASCPSDIKIASQGTSVHVAGDVVGYFIRPQTQALDCRTISGAPQTIAPNVETQLSCPNLNLT